MSFNLNEALILTAALTLRDVPTQKHHCSQLHSLFTETSLALMQPCAKVWASGFTSALLPRRDLTNEFRQNVHAWMECFFEQWLKGTAGLRLQQLAAVLQQYQTFPQLYIYSESDHVVPHTSVEAFMEVSHGGQLCTVLCMSAVCRCYPRSRPSEDCMLMSVPNTLARSHPVVWNVASKLADCASAVIESGAAWNVLFS